MKRLSLLFFLIFALSLSGCASFPAEPYSSQKRHDGAYDEYFYRPSAALFSFDAKTETEGVEILFESEMGRYWKNKGIKSILAVHRAIGIECPVFLSMKAVTHADEGEFFVNPQDEAAFIGAAYLAFLAEERLPFGIYAGAMANLLNVSHLGRSETYPLSKELQYPLFLNGHKPIAERNAAWNFAEKIANEFLSQNTMEELLSSSAEDWELIFQKFGAEVPSEYRYLVGDCAYPLQILTESFCYRFAHDFRDRHYDDFDLSYSSLREFVLENERFVRETFSYFGGGRFYFPVNVYFGNDLILKILGGYADVGRNSLCVNTAAAFSHEAAHFILHEKGFVGGQQLEEALCNYLAFLSPNASYFNRDTLCLLDGNPLPDHLTGVKDAIDEASRFLYGIYLKIYEKDFGELSAETYRPLRLALVIAAHAQNRREELYGGSAYSTLRVSLIYYVHQTYKNEGLIELIKRWDASQIGGKDFSAILDEWETFLDALVQREIFEEGIREYSEKYL